MNPSGPGARLYALLVSAYPRRFRDAHEDDLRADFRRWSRHPRFDGPGGRRRLWSFLLADWARSMIREWAELARDGIRGSNGTKGDGGMRTMRTDLRFALRTFRRAPGFFAVAVLTVALGIGATSTMFSVADGVLLRSLPYPEADRLVQVGRVYEGWDGIGPMSPVEALALQERSRSFDAFTPSRSMSLTLIGDGEPEVLDAAAVSGEYWTALGARAEFGRLFGTDQDRVRRTPVAVISHRVWQRRWGGDPSVLGSVVTMSEVPYTIIGVAARDFVPPEAIYHRGVEVWVPFAWLTDDITSTDGFLQALARLTPGATPAAARAELSLLAEGLTAESVDGEARAFTMEDLKASTVGRAADSLLPLMGAVGLLLLITCVNVANLFLVRAGDRARELGVRTALGAGRGRIVRQLVTESVTLCTLGGALGVALAWAGVRAFIVLNPGDVPRIDEISLDGRVVVFAALLSLVTGLIFGLVPAPGRSGHPATGLREGSARAGGTRGQERLRSLLVVAETATALVLLVGSGLLINSFVRLNRVDPGFDPVGTVAVTVYRPDEAEDPAERAEERRAFWDAVVDRAARVPGVTAVDITNNLPFSGNQSVTYLSPEGLVLPDEQRPPSISYHTVGPALFDALGIRVRAGRGFTSADAPGAPLVAVVNRSGANALWPGEDPLGRQFEFGRPDGDGPWYEIVGVVDDVRQQALSSPGEPELYLSALQNPARRNNVVARSDRPAAEILPALRNAVWEVRPDLPIQRSVTLADFTRDSITSPRFYTALLSAFGAVALVLALVGIYGTLSYSVTRRTHELGVRLALGASGPGVLRMVLARGMRLVGAGLVLGLLGALATTRVLEGFVFGVTPTDPATLATVGGVLALAGALACWIPARRATRLDPVRTLRTE